MGVSNIQEQQKQQLSKYKVVIAYDFGTTYSGAAYAFTNPSAVTEVFDIKNWEKHKEAPPPPPPPSILKRTINRVFQYSGTTWGHLFPQSTESLDVNDTTDHGPHKLSNFYPKVPTLSLYPRLNRKQQKNNLSQRLTLSEWGYDAKMAMLKPNAGKDNVILSQFKLHLDESLNRPPLENGLTPLQAITDYLTALHQHTLQELSHGFAKNYHPDTFRYCLTVPAVWSDKAKSLMRQAAIQAGLISPYDPADRLILVLEPEAAALYCEETMADQVQLDDKNRIMICDAGGGTVDLIVFQVNLIKNSENSGLPNARSKRELKEVTKGMGESCGSVFLDNNFHELLKTKLGIHVMDKITPREMNTMMDYFIETIKPEFDEADDYYLELPRSVKVKDLPSDVRKLDYDGFLDDGILQFSGKELKKEVFDPVVNRVLSLIEHQYRQVPDGQLHHLFLVGGFGSSKYLYQQVQNLFQDTKVQIICPEERAALAVVRGATYFGVYPRTVISRISRRTYGINVNEAFDEKLDPISKRVIAIDGAVRCKNRFALFVKKNDELPLEHSIQKKFSILIGESKNLSLKLYATENDDIPRYVDCPGVHCIASIEIPIPKIPNMKRMDRMTTKIRMYFGKTEIRVEEKFPNGEKYEIQGDFDAIDKYDS
ncbi:hypothetical protein BDA99DRAFT_551405 [Phascolomyces articulosus]|uniref:Actin-like ATPase domain-containing protein n=1 Tax=Phascolomyces articulosus TaxID=60185 RepID=A0AAD5KFT7_9FUNG|nr:hypothetical protein BDA99DRAFT_551405 [Phascolomyces articulosus]